MSDTPDLGRFEMCLNVADLTRSIDFYEAIGFRRTGGDPGAGWTVLSNDQVIFGLYEGHIGGNVLNFRGGDVFAIHEALADRGLEFETDAHTETDGSAGAILRDPDGNVLYFNTAPGETP